MFGPFLGLGPPKSAKTKRRRMVKSGLASGNQSRGELGPIRRGTLSRLGRTCSEAIKGRSASSGGIVLVRVASLVHMCITSDLLRFRARFQLKMQNELLDLLFSNLYEFPDRPANISVGLIKGIVMSAFGTVQANREIWNADPEAQRLQQRIRDLTLVIALDALDLSTIVNAEQEQEDGEESVRPRDILLNQRDSIISLHLLLHEQSDDLTPRDPEPPLGSVGFPIWPMPILCLGWSIVLRSLTPEMSPPSIGYDRTLYEEFADRALRLPSGLFPWMEEVLCGPLFNPGVDEMDGDLSTWRRQVIRDLILGLADMIQLESIVDRNGLYRIWDLLFGGGSPSSSRSICTDYWKTDYDLPSRSAPLHHSLFPHDPTRLPRLLAALSGSQPIDSQPQAGGSAGPAGCVFEYLSSLPSVTIKTDPALCSFSVTEHGKRFASAKKTIILPGGLEIPANTNGEVITPEDANTVVVTWHIEDGANAWGFLVELLRAAVRIRRPEELDGLSPSDADYCHVSIADLSITAHTTELLSAGLGLLRICFCPSASLSRQTLAAIQSGTQASSVHVFEVCIAVVNTLRSAGLTSAETQIARSALQIINGLLLTHDPSVWTAMHHSGLFGILARRRSVLADIIEAESAKGDHFLTMEIINVVAILCSSSLCVLPPEQMILKSALHLAVAVVWSPLPGWKLKNVAAKVEMVSLLCTAFASILSHPLDSTTHQPTLSAQYLIDTFILSSSNLSYRPLIETLTRGPNLAARLVALNQNHDARAVITSMDASLSFLAILLRLSSRLATPASSLPKSLFAAPLNIDGDGKVQVAEYIAKMGIDDSLPDSTRIGALQVLKTYLDSTATDSLRPSLAGLLKDAKTTFEETGEMAKLKNPDIRAAVWDFLSTTITVQSGCASFCIGTSGNSVTGTLAIAVDQIVNWQSTLVNSPRSIASALDYCTAVIRCPGANKATLTLRSHTEFWSAIIEITKRLVPSPPTFSLSMHSEHFSSRIESYAYMVQAKASAMAVIAAELASEFEEDDDKTPTPPCQTMVMSLFRDATALSELALSAQHNSCAPVLHETQAAVLTDAGVDLSILKTISLPGERQFGPAFLYDGNPVISNDQPLQASVNLALDMLNLNWSMLEADSALTKSFGDLVGVTINWTDSDHLAADATLRAGSAIAHLLAEEERGGDVMLAIQHECLQILSRLLESSFWVGSEPDPAILSSLAGSVRKILENQIFPPLTGLRQTELPAIHKPLLRIVHLCVQAICELKNPLQLETFFAVSFAFTLEAADVVFDGLVVDTKDLSLASDLDQIVGIVCEISRTSNITLLLDEVANHNLIGRSLDVLNRTKPIKQSVAPQVASILLLHLALASNPLSAEKLAVSGILPTYSDNGIAIDAEAGTITPSSPTPQADTIHGAWCGMLSVVNALLASLADTDAGTFARTDVIPFLRVCTAQILKSISWDGETPLSLPAIEEMILISDVLCGLTRVVGPDPDMLESLARPCIAFLRGVRYAWMHPRSSSALMIPSSEEERDSLEKEIQQVDQDKQPTLLKIKERPVLTGRKVGLLKAARGIVMALVALTRAFEVLQSESEEAEEELVLDNEVSRCSTSVGVTLISRDSDPEFRVGR